MDDASEGLVELPTYAPAPLIDIRERRAAPARAKRVTLLDRLVTTAGVDRVAIDLTALDDLRAD